MSLHHDLVVHRLKITEKESFLYKNLAVWTAAQGVCRLSYYTTVQKV